METGIGDINSDFKNFCGVSQVISMELYENMGLSVYYCNVGKFPSVNDKIRHAFGIVNIPVEGEKIVPYLIDLTFKQFCTSKKCNGEKFITQDPGYFLNQTEEGKSIINQLLEFGFVELSSKVAELYIRSFELSAEILECYSGNDYIKAMEEIPCKADKEEELQEFGYGYI